MKSNFILHLILLIAYFHPHLLHFAKTITNSKDYFASIYFLINFKLDFLFIITIITTTANITTNYYYYITIIITNPQYPFLIILTYIATNLKLILYPDEKILNIKINLFNFIIITIIFTK